MVRPEARRPATELSALPSCSVLHPRARGHRARARPRTGPARRRPRHPRRGPRRVFGGAGAHAARADAALGFHSAHSELGRRARFRSVGVGGPLGVMGRHRGKVQRRPRRQRQRVEGQHGQGRDQGRQGRDQGRRALAAQSRFGYVFGARLARVFRKQRLGARRPQRVGAARPEAVRGRRRKGGGEPPEARRRRRGNDCRPARTTQTRARKGEVEGRGASAASLIIPWRDAGFGAAPREGGIPLWRQFWVV
mmetsp:Transcript_29209/g.98456  ORF Transcript_29209/g.98456 Transcript_29209/m.98456 type:complete len:251 (+) Transcript_29209:354-1106(+)